jgi:hypothetical protein
VNGSDAVKIVNLPADLRQKLARISARHKPAAEKGKVPFLLITDLGQIDEETLATPSIIVSGPIEADRAGCSLFAFVSSKAVMRCDTVNVTCNCGGSAYYVTASKSNICQCRRCGTKIGLFAVSGDGSYVAIQNPDGSPGRAPIQGTDRFQI